MKFQAPDTDRVELLRGLQGLLDDRSLLDVTLWSRDGTCFEAHRVVLAAASRPLAASLRGHFCEGRCKALELDAGPGALGAMLDYIYGKQVDLPAQDGPQALALAHFYGLEGLEKALVAAMTESMQPAFAVQVLAECGLLGFTDLEVQCELVAAKHFEACAKSDAFVELSAAQLGRLLRHEDLVVSSEEAVLRAVLRWGGAACGRQSQLGLLFQHLRFPLMALSSLRTAEVFAQGAGPCGIELQREARRAMEVHSRGGPPPQLRRCYPRWWPRLGCSVPGGVVVPALKGVQHGRGLVLSGGSVYVADTNRSCVLRWPVGSPSAQAVAGRGAPTVGAADLSEMFTVAAAPDGELFIADFGHNRVLRVLDSRAEPLWNVTHPWAVSSAQGAIFVLAEEGSAVHKFENGVGSVLFRSSGKEGSPTQFKGPPAGMFVSDLGEVYIADTWNHRVQYWAPGASEAVTVAGGHGPGEEAEQLNLPCGVSVAPDGSVYVADTMNHRVMRWRRGSRAGVVVAGGHGQGTEDHQLDRPLLASLDAEACALYVSDFRRITRWGPAPALHLG